MHLYVLFMGSLGNALNVNVLKARLCSSCRMRVHACIVWYAAICIGHAYCISYIRIMVCIRIMYEDSLATHIMMLWTIRSVALSILSSHWLELNIVMFECQWYVRIWCVRICLYSNSIDMFECQWYVRICLYSNIIDVFEYLYIRMSGYESAWL